MRLVLRTSSVAADMREMKNSGIAWAGVCPSLWKTEKFKYHFKRRTVKNPGEAQVLSLYREYGVIPKDSRDDNHNVTSEDTSKYLFVRKGDFVINKMKAWQGSVAVSEYEGIVSPAYYVYEFVGKTTYRRYIHYLMRNKALAAEFRRLSGGIREGQWDLAAASLENSLIFIPPMQEQQAIANYLDTKCAEIDALMEDIRAEISTLEEYKKSVITEAVTKGLNPDVEMKDSGIAWVGKCPEHWEVKGNKYIMHKIKHIQPLYQGEDILSLSMKGVVVRDLEAGGKMPTSFDGYQILYSGNLLMCLFDYDVTPRCIGLIKNYGVSSPAYSQFVLDNRNNAAYYYYYYLMIDNEKSILHLAKNLRHSFTEEQLGGILAPVPPTEEQQAIADYLDAKCDEIAATIAEKQKQLTTLEEYKKSLIYEYVTGKKEVPTL